MVASLALASEPSRERIVLARVAPVSIGLFLADANGRNERRLLPEAPLAYNASFSPDGKWIVFTAEGSGSAEIYRVRPNGLGLQRLTNSPSYNDQGALSPDGHTLAFVSTRDGGTANIWLLDLTSTRTVNLTRNGSGNFRPAWSQDGQWLAFTSDRDTPHRRIGPDPPPPAGSGCCGWELVHFTAIYIVHRDGSGLRRLTPLDQFARSPKWSPDGKQLLYQERSDARGAFQIASIDVADLRTRILTAGNRIKSAPQFVSARTIGYLMTREGGETALTLSSGSQGPPGKIRNPSWSPDGAWVVYDKVLSEYPSGFAAPTVFADASAKRDFDFYRNDICTAFSADAIELAMTACFRGGKALMVMHADGTGLRQLFDSTAQNANVTAPAWSRDGKYIAFALGPRGVGSRNPITPAQIATIGYDGSHLRVLTHGSSNSAYPSFSPDGKRLVFRVLGRERGLRIASLSNGSITTLTGEWDDFPVWSPDGERIVFSSFRTGDSEIFTIRADGSDLRQLTHDRGNDAHALWSPDGKSVLFTSSRMGWKDESDGQSYGELFIMLADGTRLRQLTDNQWEDAPTAWLPRASSR